MPPRGAVPHSPAPWLQDAVGGLCRATCTSPAGAQAPALPGSPPQDSITRPAGLIACRLAFTEPLWGLLPHNRSLASFLIRYLGDFLLVPPLRTRAACMACFALESSSATTSTRGRSNQAAASPGARETSRRHAAGRPWTDGWISETVEQGGPWEARAARCCRAHVLSLAPALCECRCPAPFALHPPNHHTFSPERIFPAAPLGSPHLDPSWLVCLAILCRTINASVTTRLRPSISTPRPGTCVGAPSLDNTPSQPTDRRSFPRRPQGSFLRAPAMHQAPA